jgi:hypothetical protein
MMSNITNQYLKTRIREEEKRQIQRMYDEGMKWMKENFDTADVEGFDAKKIELEQKFRPIKDRIYREAGLMQPMGDDNDDLE